MPIGFALLPGRLLAVFASGPLPDTVQVFQADHTVGMRSNDAPTDTVVGVQLQPSLSSGKLHQFPGGRPSAFAL